jgi:CRISPR-associated protein Csm1
LLADLGCLQARALGSNTIDHNKLHEWLKKIGLGDTGQDIVKWRIIIDEARELALGGLPSEGDQKDISHPLVSVFSKVSFECKYHDCWRYFPATKMEVSPTFPSKELTNISSEAYFSLWKGLEDEIRGLTSPTPDTLLLILEKYTSFIPYCPGKNENPLSDIPFFDQIKVTAAIASSLYYFMNERGENLSKGVDMTTPMLLLIGGDFSGVQPFIYNISSKGALKGLRGRSFFLEFFTEHVIYEILAPLGLSRANIIFSGGSRFNLLLPNSESVINHLETVRDNINKYLWEQHDARLYLVLKWIGLSGPQLMVPQQHRGLSEPAESPLAKRFGELAEKISLSKRAKFFPYLNTMLEPKLPLKGEKEAEICWRLKLGGKTYKGECPRCGKREAHKLEFALDRGKVDGCEVCLGDKRISFDECEVCHREDFLFPLPYPSEEIGKGDVPSACAFCCDLFHIGEHLPFSRYIVRVKEGRGEEKIALTVGDVDYVFLDRDRQELIENTECVWVINDLDSQLYKERSAYPFFLAVYPRGEEVAKEGEENVPGKVQTEFEKLAGQSTGIKRIGALRMDVDNLGAIATGRGFFRAEEKNSLSRIAALSRYLTNFFKLYINEFCRGKGLPSSQARVIAPDERKEMATNRKVIIIYSGGDDLFAVGAWNDIAELPFDLHDCFRLYTGNNPDITLSAGTVVREHSYPLHHVAEDAHKAEKASKENQGDKNGKGKDSLALFFPSLLFPPQAGALASSDSDLAERLVRLLDEEAIRGALKWEDGDFPAPSALNLLELTKRFVRELGDGEESGVLQLKPGSRAFIYQLLNVVEVRRAQGKLFFPLLCYSLSSPVAGSKISNELETCLLDMRTMSYLHPVLTWVDLLGREK